MDLLERGLFLAIGGGLGFILGYLVARLQVIESKVDAVKTEVHEVDEIVKRKKDEAGFMRGPKATEIAYVIGLFLIIVGLWQTYIQGREMDSNIRCNTEYLKTQAEFLSVILTEPPTTDREQRDALQRYYNLLSAYADSANEPSRENIEKYNITDEFKTCLYEEE